jgi:hypothetical protein
MFGVLLGTLNKFKTDADKKSEAVQQLVTVLLLTTERHYEENNVKKR